MNTRKLKFSRSFRSDLFFPLFLTVCILGLIFLSVPSGSMFGSEVDWLCQHVAIADYMRKQFLSSGSLVPDYMHLGGGGSFLIFPIMDFSGRMYCSPVFCLIYPQQSFCRSMP